MAQQPLSSMRVVLAACIAPCASPLLTAVYAWIALHVGAQSVELGRWIRFDDLWPLFVWEFVVALVITWCAGYPIFAMARSRNAVSVAGMCIAATVTGAVFLFLLATVASILSMFSWFALVASVIGAIKGFAIAATFSALAGVPRIAPHSMLLQRDVTKADA